MEVLSLALKQKKTWLVSITSWTEMSEIYAYMKMSKLCLFLLLVYNKKFYF